MNLAVSTSHLSKTYSRILSKRKVFALQDLTLRIESGEIYGLLGPNGAGKTTLLKLLLGVARPTRGLAFIFGEPISDPSSRMAVGFLPENHRFPPFLTATQSLLAYGRMSNLNGTKIRQRTEELLERVGLTEWANIRVREYSKGMMQRLGLAQALLNSPKLLFLDEPTDGVDPIGRRHIRDLLLSLRQDGVTIFLNSHLLSEVELVCTRVGILHRGRMVQSGSIEELTDRSNHYQFHFPDSNREQLARDFPEHEAHVNIESPGRVAVRIETKSATELNHHIDVFRANGLEIVAIVPDHRSLESRFMEIIEALELESDPIGSPTEDVDAQEL